MKLLILDAGHNEFVAGKEAPDKSMREWEFNDDMQNRISKLLEAYSNDIEVYLTNPNPEGKDEIGLTKRATLGNSYWKAQGKPEALFVSLHANAWEPWSTPNGCETYHAGNASVNSINAAGIMNKHIHAALKVLNPNSVNRGVKTSDHTVTYKSAMPAILVEYAFYTNKTDLVILKNNRHELAVATVKAICEYFKIAFKEPVEKPAANFLVKIIYAGSEGLNIRQEPNTKSAIKGQVYKDQVFTIVERYNDWGRLKSGVGWISLNSKYVTIL